MTKGGQSVGGMPFPDIFSEFGKHVLFEIVLARFKQIVEVVQGSDTENAAKNIYADSCNASLFLRHRKKVYGRVYESAFKSGKDVLYVSIMSKDTLNDMREYLNNAKIARTTLRVLTWNPRVGSQAIEAFRKHLGEYEFDPSGAAAQISDIRSLEATGQGISECHYWITQLYVRTNNARRDCEGRVGFDRTYPLSHDKRQEASNVSLSRIRPRTL
ncbi:MAG TPA: hypothetical protein VFA76_05370 [Terriglobales bacterium]|nr:hypothetical protein [Terriglobales bacterium]